MDREGSWGDEIKGGRERRGHMKRMGRDLRQ